MRGPYVAISAVLITALTHVDARAPQAAVRSADEPDTPLGRVSAIADVENFCCPDYLMAVVAAIKRNWTPPPAGLPDGTAGVTFAIESDGRVGRVSLEKRSGNGILDMSVLNAMAAVRQLPALPAGFKQWTLPVRVAFDYGKFAEPHAAGPEVRFDTRGVEFRPWLGPFMAAIKSHWLVPASASTAVGHVTVTFNLHKNGSISDITVTNRSFFDVFNSAALNAIVFSNPAQPLPDGYPLEAAFFSINFFYNERPPRNPPDR